MGAQASGLMATLAARALARRLAGQPGQGQSSAASSGPGAQVSAEYTRLASARPQELLEEMNAIRSKLTAAMGASDRIPELAKGLTRAIPAINSAIQALEKAASAVKIISPQINNSVAPGASGSPGGVPGAPGQAQIPLAT